MTTKDLIILRAPALSEHRVKMYYDGTHILFKSLEIAIALGRSELRHHISFVEESKKVRIQRCGKQTCLSTWFLTYDGVMFILEMFDTCASARMKNAIKEAVASYNGTLRPNIIVVPQVKKQRGRPRKNPVENTPEHSHAPSPVSTSAPTPCPPAPTPAHVPVPTTAERLGELLLDDIFKLYSTAVDVFKLDNTFDIVEFYDGIDECIKVMEKYSTEDVVGKYTTGVRV